MVTEIKKCVCVRIYIMHTNTYIHIYVYFYMPKTSLDIKLTKLDHAVLQP